MTTGYTLSYVQQCGITMKQVLLPSHVIELIQNLHKV